MAKKFLRWIQVVSPASSLALCLALTNSLLAQNDYGRCDVSAQRLIATVKPTPAELRWQQIPWELDLKEAIDLAKKEKRPIFFWAAGGRGRDGVPLERC